MPTTVTSTIGTSSRNYSTIQAWEDACPANLVTDDKIWRGECYNDAAFVEAVTFAGITTDTTRRVVLTAAAGQSFQDAGGVRTNALRPNQANGVLVSQSTNYTIVLEVNQAGDFYFTVSRLQIQNTATNARALDDIFLTCHLTMEDCIIAAQRPNVAVAVGYVDLAANVLSIVNNATAQAGFYANFSPSTFIGCDFVCPSNILSTSSGVHVQYGTTSVLQSCAVFGFTTPVNDTGKFDGTLSKYNGTDAASGLPGTNNQHSVTYTSFTPFVNATIELLDARSIAATSLINNGFLDATNAPNDISGTARTATPTIGAWEVTAGGGPPAMGGRFHRIVTRPAAYRPGIAR